MRWRLAAALVMAVALSPIACLGTFQAKYHRYLHLTRLQAAVSDLDRASRDVGSVLASLDYLSYKATLYDNTVKMGGNPGRDRMELLKALVGAERRLRDARIHLDSAERKGVNVSDVARTVSRVAAELEEARRLVELGRTGVTDRIRAVARLARVENRLELKKRRLMEELTARMPRMKYYELVENVLFLPPFNALFAL
ncbi:MAG: hypothetical protein ABGY09_06685, partial [Euryarchaeota archaeon]